MYAPSALPAWPRRNSGECPTPDCQTRKSAVGCWVRPVRAWAPRMIVALCRCPFWSCWRRTVRGWLGRVDDPRDQRLEIDVCLPPQVDDAGWRDVDLELDPVLHERDRRVEVEDWDEYDEACRDGWMCTDDAALARATAQRCAELLQRRTEPWIRRGWQMLRRLAWHHIRGDHGQAGAGCMSDARGRCPRPYLRGAPATRSHPGSP
jgi:hypothetical protein